MLVLVVVMASYVVEGQDCHPHLFARAPTLHWYADVILRHLNQGPFGTLPHPAHYLKTLLSDGAPARQAAGLKDVYRQNNVCGVCFVTKNLFCVYLFCVFAPGLG